MKKTLVFFVLLSALFLTFAIDALAGPAMDRIMKRGELLVGTSGAQPPLTATTKKGELIGLDIDIAKAMADSLGVKVKFVLMPFAKLLPALESNQVDIILSALTITPKRNQKVAFAGPYYVSGKGILAVAEKYAALQEAKGLNTPEVTIAALKNSTSQKFAETLIPKAKLVLTNSYKESIDLLFKGKIDVIVADYYFCALTAYRYQSKGLIAGESRLTYEPLGIAMSEDTLLINWVQNFINILKGSGKLKEMGKKWLTGGPWIDELP
ncbi:MAG: transporter substrate-binding domain-containing protein [Desulfobacterales bacterium]|jgi:polar amino acid transport system substrate-binding protein|nr:transporter substrate-binding domain-containing protein [Desulfobacterales bacterium]